jgi:S-DNA-T family DNA segregation ATPase FtsK/SpoIIIE
MEVNQYSVIGKIIQKNLNQFYPYYQILFLALFIFNLFFIFSLRKLIKNRKINSSFYQEKTENILTKSFVKKSFEGDFETSQNNLKSQSLRENTRETKNFILPSTSILNKTSNQNFKLEGIEELNETSKRLLKVLNDFGVKGEIIDIHQGPVVTLYEFEPFAGTKSSRVIGLADDIARSLSALSTRISVIPGRNVLGIELPNKQRMFFNLRELLESKEYNNKDILLPVVLGRDLSGKPLVVDLSKMPHLLVAGTTGSGKSVGINAFIFSILYRYSPEECKFIMIDPKMLELSIYDDIPHLLTPVVTQSDKAVTALKWAVKEMENRYRMMSNLGVRNISGYNAKVEEFIKKGENFTKTLHTGFDSETKKPTYQTLEFEAKKLPFIVIIVDEMADLMLVAGKDIEASIQRLAQMARAAGIHLVMATQRPSVDVITGVIKANFPSRISFKVTSKIDSRTILGEMGAEQLLGQGDMLYMGTSKIVRVHGPFIDDLEVEKVSSHLKSQGKPEYINSVIEKEDGDLVFEDGSDSESDDGLYRQALAIVKRDKKASTSYVQRCLRIGYNRAALIIERMEREGIITPPNHSGKRELLVGGEED